jgi:hypothetical protein
MNDSSSDPPPQPGTSLPERFRDAARQSFLAVDPLHGTVAMLGETRGLAISAYDRRDSRSPYLIVVPAYLDLKNRPLVILPGADHPRILAGLHPSELYELFAEPGALLPEPRTLLVGGDDALDRAKTLTEWFRFTALQLTVRDADEAAVALEWLNAGWRIVGANELTVWATRFA